jgi:ABC-type branched-subunit amino acid transport system ATPase component
MTDTSGMLVRDLTVRYGGVLAVDRVSLDVPVGAITGLIGPNGAGKSSLFGACAGAVPASGGSKIEIFGRDATRYGAVHRARLGLGRTFQRIQLFHTMTVRQNVAMGHLADYARRNPLSLVYASPAERRETRRVTDELLEHCGLSAIAERVAGSLSTGEQRMVELARVLASPARLLLLDEPSSGLSPEERQRFAEILREACGSMGRGVFLVEHDMDLIAAVCSRIHVLNFGKLIFSGTLRDALADDAVQQSYLGVASTAAPTVPEGVTHA